MEDQEPRLHEPGPAFSRLHFFLRLEQDSLFLCALPSRMQSTSSLRRYPASSVGDLRPPLDCLSSFRLRLQHLVVALNLLACSLFDFGSLYPLSPRNYHARLVSHPSPWVGNTLGQPWLLRHGSSLGEHPAQRGSLIQVFSRCPLWEHQVQTTEGSFPATPGSPRRTAAPADDRRMADIGSP